MYRKFWLLINLSLLPVCLQAQARYGHEVGFGAGVLNYTGDITPSYHIQHAKPAAMIIYRYSISPVISFRTSLTYGKIGSSEVPIDALTKQRDASFTVSLVEPALGFEYHFFNWRDNVRRMRYSPYVHVGMALFGFSTHADKQEQYSQVQFSFPLGVGIKYVINRKYYLALEYGIRKTFFDYLDNISDNNLMYKNYQYGNPYDYDSYSFVGLTLVYTFYEIPCAASPYKRGPY